MLKIVHLTFVVSLLLAILGCRTPDPTVELLESELRWMEDNLYALDDQLDRCCEQLESAQRNNSALRSQLAVDSPNTSKRSNDSNKAEPTPKGAQSNVQPFDEESGEEDLLKNLRAPEVEYGTPEEKLPQSGSDETEELPNGVDLQGIPNAEEIREAKPTENPSNPFQDSKAPDSNKIIRIQLNSQLTGGYDFDGKPGSEGVMVVFEPQNASKEYLAQSGDVTVEVRNPNKRGIAGQVAKWKFDAIEVAARIEESLLGRGVHLKLPWPNGFPESEHVKLVVGFDTQEGQHLEAEKDLIIKIPASPTVMAHSQQESANTSDTWAPVRAASVPPLLEWNPDRR